MWCVTTPTRPKRDCEARKVGGEKLRTKIEGGSKDLIGNRGYARFVTAKRGGFAGERF